MKFVFEGCLREKSRTKYTIKFCTIVNVYNPVLGAALWFLTVSICCCLLLHTGLHHSLALLNPISTGN